jgi:hypothetical protein
VCVEARLASAGGDPVRKAINLAGREPLLETKRENIAFFEQLPEADRPRVDFGTVRGTQSSCAGMLAVPSDLGQAAFERAGYVAAMRAAKRRRVFALDATNPRGTSVTVAGWPLRR